MTLLRHALIPSLALSALLATACGDDDPPVEGNDGGAQDASADADPETLVDAGDSVEDELPAPGSQECMDAEDEGFTAYEEADCETREDEDGNAVCGSCWSQSPASGDNTCSGFFCNWTEVQIECQIDRPLGACNTRADLELGCDSSIQDAVAECARDAQGMVISSGGEFTQDDARAYTKSCSREILTRVVSPACLDCYVDSAECARDNCLGRCLAGDSEDCDQCRENEGCTPAFFECTGFPDPQQVNPDGTAR